MPRQPRIDSPGLLHHVMARGNEKRVLFPKERDYVDFLGRLARLLGESGNQCFTWALMPNHVHLLLRSGVQGISRMLQRLLGGYAVAFNLRYQRVGHLFQNRFKSIICEENPYFLELVRYIPLNPIRGGLVKSLEDLRTYPWTGHTALMGTINLPWQSTTDILQCFGKDLETARRGYETFLREGLTQGHREDLEGGGLIRSLGGIAQTLQARATGMPLQGDVRILGSGEFVEKVLAPFKTIDSLDEERVSLEKVILDVTRLTGRTSAELRSTTRTIPISRAKSLLIHWGVERAGKTLLEMAKVTGMSASAATRAIRRGKDVSHQLSVDVEPG